MTGVILWIVLFVIFAIAEAVTFNLVSIWFCFGAVCAMAAAKAGLGSTAQLVVFVVVSFALFIMARPFVKRFLKIGNVKTNADRIIGSKADVVEKISGSEPGAVKADGKIWTARSAENDKPFEKGDVVEIVRIEGVTVYVK